MSDEKEAALAAIAKREEEEEIAAVNSVSEKLREETLLSMRKVLAGTTCDMEATKGEEVVRYMTKASGLRENLPAENTTAIYELSIYAALLEELAAVLMIDRANLLKTLNLQNMVIGVMKTKMGPELIQQSIDQVKQDIAASPITTSEPVVKQTKHV